MESSAHLKKTIIGGVTVTTDLHRTALVFSLFDGMFANIMLGLVETFGIAAAVFLKAPAIAIALLGSLPLFLSSLGQLVLPYFTNPEAGRKRYVLRGTTAQSLFLLCVAASGYLPGNVRPWVYVTCFALYGFSGNVISGFWIAWMGDLVPRQVRGRHFAWRNRIFSLTQLLCVLLAGIISRRYTTNTAQWSLFAVIFFTASLARFISSGMIFRQYEPPVIAATTTGKRTVSLFDQPRPFLFYCFSAALIQGSVALAGPFFNVWYIRDLHFDYFSLSTVTVATILGTIVSLPFWGKIADTYGNRTVILITVFLISTVPLPYIASSKPWQIGVLNFYTGVCWSGYNLCNFNYLLAAAGARRTEQSISLAVAITGIVNFIFSMIGGALATRLPQLFAYRLHSLFLLSSIMRFVVFGLFIVRYPKYEPETGASLNRFFQIAGYRVGLGLLRNTFRAFRSR